MNGIIRIGITMVNFLIKRGKCFTKLNSHTVFIVTLSHWPTPIKALRVSLHFFNFDIVQICSRLENCYATCAHWVQGSTAECPTLEALAGQSTVHIVPLSSLLAPHGDHWPPAPSSRYRRGPSSAQTNPSPPRGGVTQHRLCCWWHVHCGFHPTSFCTKTRYIIANKLTCFAIFFTINR